MSKVSIIIPSRNEKYLQRTVQDVYDKATGDFEVIVGLNGKTEFEIPSKFPNLRIIEEAQNIGLKPMINKLAKEASGKYVYKSDSHCTFGEGFDEILQADIEDDWIVTPRFYVLDADKWAWQDDRFYDYFHLCCPFTDPKGIRFKAGGHWPERTQAKLDVLIDETSQIHGSGWFVNRDYYFNVLGGFPEDDPDGHAQEPIWLGLKNWLMGGKVMVNKKTWYAHTHQDSNQRGYKTSNKHARQTYKMVADYWLENKWPKRIHDFDWFVDKFYPMPTWPENWREVYNKWRGENGKNI